MVEAVVRCLGPRSHHLGGVIEPSQQAPIVKIKHLLPGMGGNAGREVYLQTSPSFTFLVPWLDLSELEICSATKKGAHR